MELPRIRHISCGDCSGAQTELASQIMDAARYQATTTTLQTRYGRIYVERKYYCLLHQTALKLRFEEHKIGICWQSLFVIIFVCEKSFPINTYLYPYIAWSVRLLKPPHCPFDQLKDSIHCTASKYYYSAKAYEINCKVYIFVCFSYIYCYYTYK